MWMHSTDESIVYTGIGAAGENFLKQVQFTIKIIFHNLLLLNEKILIKSLLIKEADFLDLDAKKLDANFVALQKKNIEKSALSNNILKSLEPKN
jgi:hypothetical protein